MKPLLPAINACATSKHRGKPTRQSWPNAVATTQNGLLA
jgi:hypothetical protein